MARMQFLNRGEDIHRCSMLFRRIMMALVHI